MNFIQYGKKKINFEIKRGNRKKTVAIHVNPIATVTVLAPQYLSEEKIRMMVQKKARWIIEKQEIIRENKHFNSVKEFVSGEAFPYLGREYRLKVVKSNSEKEGKCELINGRFLVEINKNLENGRWKEAVKMALMDWYLVHAKKKIQERVDYYSAQIGEKPAYIDIRKQKKRWGSCSHTGVVRLNWKIIMEPISVIDYVIVHELCHLKYPHHSSQFWQKVQSIIVDYKKRRELLKQYSYTMDVLG